MKKEFFFSKIIFITLLAVLPLFSTARAEGAQIFGPSALYKEDSYTFVLDRIQNVFNSDSVIKMYIYNPKLEISFSEEQVIDQTSLGAFYFHVPENTLAEGDYFVSIEVTDNVGKSRVVGQKEIGVLSNGKTWVTRHKEILFAIFAFVIIIAMIHHIAKDRELYAHLKRIKIERKKKTKKRTKSAKK